jgi:hypothetical protein
MNISSKFIRLKINLFELKTAAEVAWNFPCEQVLAKIETLQPWEQMSNLFWNFSV